jgi:4-diphosphocytidyl-2-C-methyl-D-erythritol kinase
VGESIRVFAKVNLFLRILSRRNDGFHEIQTLMHPIGLSDEIDLERADGYALVCDSPQAPPAEKNTVTRAWRLLKERFGTRVGGARFVLRKRIPTEAGLGGASADAAGALLCMNRAFGLQLPNAQLMDLAAEIGSDAPFFLAGGAAEAVGRGEKLLEIDSALSAPVVLALSEKGVSTKEAYGRFSPGAGENPPDLEALKRAVVRGQPRDVAGLLFNTFERLVFPIRPDLAHTKQSFLDCGASGALMTGSGATVFAIGIEGSKGLGKLRGQLEARGAKLVQSEFRSTPYEWL